jgi:hypothetical protein
LHIMRQPIPGRMLQAHLKGAKIGQLHNVVFIVVDVIDGSCRVSCLPLHYH